MTYPDRDKVTADERVISLLALYGIEWTGDGSGVLRVTGALARHHLLSNQYLDTSTASRYLGQSTLSYHNSNPPHFRPHPCHRMRSP